MPCFVAGQKSSHRTLAITVLYIGQGGVIPNKEEEEKEKQKLDRIKEKRNPERKGVNAQTEERGER